MTHSTMYSTLRVGALFLSLFLVVHILPSVYGEGCLSKGLCCQGKNLSCVVQSEEEGRTCFCDSACLELDDCCPDYRTSCQPVDCVIEEAWGPWGECDVKCGPGMRQRTRRVLRAPLNGGRECPNVVERVACEGKQCKVARDPGAVDQLKETGLIIPATYGRWREDVKYDPFRDIRRNLFERYQSNKIIDRPTYCMEFEVVEKWAPCEDIIQNNRLCVECEPFAMKKYLGSRCVGHGAYGRPTPFLTALETGCHGKWVLKSRKEGCQCDQKSPDSFILL